MIVNERPGRASRRSGELDWLLDDMVGRVAEIRHVVVLSNDDIDTSAVAEPLVDAVSD